MILQRTSQDDYSTLGEFRFDDGTHLCYTLEKPWVDVDGDGIGDRGKSCIPAGIFVLRRRWSPKHNAELFGIEQVPGRSDIEVHSANLPSQLEGCVAVGDAYGPVAPDDLPGILHSRVTLAAFMEALEGQDNIPLTVIDP